MRNSPRKKTLPEPPRARSERAVVTKPFIRGELHEQKTAAALAVLLLTFTGACNTSGIDSSNLLLGKWKLTSGATGCDATMDYEKTQASFVGYDGQPRSMAVTYVAANQDKMPTSVFVITNAGISNHTTWNFSDKNTVQLDAYTMCTYTRQ